MKVSKFFWLFLFLMVIDMIVIFMFSAQGSVKSSNISKGITTSIIEKSNRNVEDLTKREFFYVESFVRKTGHIVLFMALGIFSCLTLKSSIGKKNKWVIYVLSSVFCILYASSDEFHQTFIKGRDGNVIDVLIDTCGSLVGIAGVWLASKKYNFGIK